MNLFVSLLASILSGHLFGVVKSDGFIAINSAASVRKLYERVRNRDAPSPESDPAYTDANIRKRICEEITGSGYFTDEGLRPVTMKPNELSKRLQDKNIFSRIYAKIPRLNTSSSPLLNAALPIILPPTFEYQNLFTPEKLLILTENSGGKRKQILEHVFVCFLKDEEGYVSPFYVSKEYNVVGDPFRAGRFIFAEARSTYLPFFITDVLLAEEPAKVFEDKENPKYNVELKYLERRLDLPLSPNDDSDPVCSLLPQSEADNEQDRLCAMVMTSSDFKPTKFEYPKSWPFPPKCEVITVSFQSAEAEKIAGGKVYQERASRCPRRHTAREGFDFFYVVRTYVPNEVFVLKDDFWKGKIFLKNLSTDVGIVRGGVTV